MVLKSPHSIWILRYRVGARVGMCVCSCGLLWQTTAVLSRLPGPSTAHSSSKRGIGHSRKLTTTMSTCATSLSGLEIDGSVRCDSSHAGSRHGGICGISAQEPHAPRHHFGDPRSALPARGHLKAPVPSTRTE